MLQNVVARCRQTVLAVTLGALALLVTKPAAARPVIDHEPPRAVARQPLAFSARVTSPGTVLQAFLCYRVLHGAAPATDPDLALQLATGLDADGGAAAPPPPQKGVALPDFRILQMQPGEADTYQATVGAGELDADSLEYFIVAYDAADLSEGYWHSRESPQRVYLPILHPVETPDAGSPDDNWNPSAAQATTTQNDIVKKAQQFARQGSFDGAIAPPYQLPGRAGYLRVVSDPPGVAVTLDGSSVGYTPIEKAIPVGTHLIVGKKKGYEDEKRVVGIANGHGRQVAMHMIPVGSKRP